MYMTFSFRKKRRKVWRYRRGNQIL